jgi:hypothetical protein
MASLRGFVPMKRWSRKISARMDSTDETTGVTDAGLGRLEANRIRQISSAFNCRFLGPNSRYKTNQVNEK